MTLPDLSATAKLDTAPWSKSIDVVLRDLRQIAALSKKPRIIKITAELSGSKKPLADLDALHKKAATPIKIGANGEGLRDVNRIIRETTKELDGIRNIWRLEAISNEEATLAAKRHRDELLKLAAAEDANAEATLKAVKAAAQAQNLMNQAQGKPTRGGFAFNTSLGIIEALQNLSGPAGAAAGLIGQFITQGLSQGMERGSKGVEAEALELSDDVISTIKKKLQIQSPSKVMEQVGQFIVQGLIRGFKSDTGALLNTVRQVGAQVPPAFQQGARGLSGGGFAGIAKEFQSAGEAADELKPQLDGASKGMNAAMNGAEALTAALTPVAAAALTFGAALAASVPKAAEFEKALKNIAAESDLTSGDLAEIGRGLLQVSDDIGTSSIGLAKTAYDIVGAGVKGAESNAEIVKLARQSALLAGAGMADVASAADTLTSALNAYGYSAVNAEHVSDVLFQTTNAGKISIAQMGGTMNEVFPLAAKLGVDLENLGGSIAALTSVGVPAEQAVTGIQGVLTNILKPSEGATKAAHELGIGFDAATLKAKGLNVFLNDLAKAVGGNTAIMGELFDDVNAINAVFALTSDVGAKKYTEALEKMAQANGATAQGYADVASSYSHAQEKFQTSIENLQIIFATKYLPTITKGIDATSKFVQNLDEFGQNGVVQFALFAGGAAIAFNAVTKLRIAVNALAGGTALTTAVANFGGIGAAIAGLGADVATLGLVGAGAAVAMAPMLTLALGIGAAFAGWKIGQWIGDLKLFGDTTTTVNDKLTDFFATTLFGADPQAIREMRAMEEAEQRRAQAAGESADEYTKAADAIKAQAAAEREAIKAEQAAAAAREAQLQLLREQKAAIEDLQKNLSDRKFKLSLEGKTNLQKDLAEIGKTFDDLAEKARKPFMVGGKLQSTPALEAVLKELKAQQKAEEASARSSYADQAVKAARKTALEAQKAELDAMQEGRAKKAAERKLEIEELQRANQEEADKYKDFPEQYKQIVSDGQREVAALKRKHRQEDIATAEDHAKRIKEAETRAAQSVLDAMQDGYAKQELARRLALAQLKSDIAERVRALEGDPAAQAKVKSEGQKEINNRIQADNLARLKEVQDAQAAIRDAELAGADARVAALADGFAKEEAVRALALVKLKDGYQKRIDAEKGRPDVQKALMGERDDAVASLETQNAQARTAAIKAGNDAVYEAQKAARAAENALIKDDLAKKQAAQNEELSDLQRNIQKKLDGFKGTEEQRKKILEAGQAQVRALNKKHLQEDADDAKERARRIAQAWQEVQEKQFAAQQAARERELAQFDAQQARIQRSFTDDPVRQAGAAGDAIPQRYQLEEQLAAKQYAADRQRLENIRKFALDAENLTADQKRIIWENYYADLKKLDEGYQKGRVDAAARKDQEQADALERVRQTMLARGQEALEPLAARRQELEWARDLATTDTERLRITRELQGVIAQQVAGQQNLLKGSAGVLPNDQERKQINQNIATLQHDQTSNLKTQKDLTKSVADEQQRILRSSLARLEAEAGFAEKYARTDADLLNARQKSMEAYRKQLAQVNAELVKSGGDTEKTNELLDQRDTIMGKLLDKQKEIDAMPGEAEQRRLGIMQAQRGLMLEMAGLQDNAIAQAQERVRTAQEEYQFALKTLATKPEGSADYDKAKQDALQKQTGLISAQRALVKARVDEETRALDLYEAQARAQLTFNDLADDAVATAELELDITRRRLAELDKHMAAGTAEPNAARDRVNLLKQQTEQERTLIQAQRDRVKLLEALDDAQLRLNIEANGGTRQQREMADALNGVVFARTALARAEREYGEAQAKGKPEKIKEATEALTGAIKAQRDAVLGLADAYAKQIGQMESVQTASERLKQVLGGDKPESNPGAFNGGQEIQRLKAIQSRRDQAQQELIAALKEGDPAAIAKATNNLATQQERLNKQRQKLIDKGYGNAINPTAGDQLSRQLSNQVDALGIVFDKESVALEQRAVIANQEAAAVMQFGEHVGQFSQSVGVGLKPLLQQIQQLKPSETSYLYKGERFSSLAERDAWIRGQGARPTTMPAFQSYVFNLTIEGSTITASSPQDAARVFEKMLDQKISDAKRSKGWGDMKCSK